MTRRVAVAEYLGHLRAGEPIGQLRPVVQVLLADLRPGDRRRYRARSDPRGLLVPVVFGKVYELLEWDDLDANLVAVLFDQVLRIVRAVEGLAR